MAIGKLTVIPGGLSTFRTTPPGQPDLPGNYRLRALMEPELAAQACLLLGPRELDWLQRRIDLFCSTRTPLERTFALHRSFESGLVLPAMTDWDLRVLSPMWQEIDERFIDAVAAFDAHPAEFPDCAERFHVMIDAYRTGDPDVARAAMRHHIGHLEVNITPVVDVAS